MKTTVELPDDLLVAMKLRAAREGRRLKDVMAEVIRRGLAEPSGRSRETSARVRVPLVLCAHPARPEDEMTPERVAAVLLAGEVQESPDDGRSVR